MNPKLIFKLSNIKIQVLFNIIVFIFASSIFLKSNPDFHQYQRFSFSKQLVNKDTVIVYDTIYNYDTVYVVETVYDTIYQFDTIVLQADKQNFFDSQQMISKVDTSAKKEKVNSVVGIVKIKIILKIIVN